MFRNHLIIALSDSLYELFIDSAPSHPSLTVSGRIDTIEEAEGGN